MSMKENGLLSDELKVRSLVFDLSANLSLLWEYIQLLLALIKGRTSVLCSIFVLLNLFVFMIFELQYLIFDLFLRSPLARWN